MRPRIALVMPLAAAAIVSACGSTSAGDTTSSTTQQTPDPATRPASPAVLSITSPAPGTVHGATVHVVVTLQNAHVIGATTTNIKPDEGHVHLYLDNNLIYMQYALEQDVPVHPGTYSLKAEFVASDHFPFNPRDWSTNTVIFTVT